MKYVICLRTSSVVNIKKGDVRSAKIIGPNYISVRNTGVRWTHPDKGSKYWAWHVSNERYML